MVRMMQHCFLQGAIWHDGGRSSMAGVRELRQHQHGKRSRSAVRQGNLRRQEQKDGMATFPHLTGCVAPPFFHLLGIGFYVYYSILDIV